MAWSGIGKIELVLPKTVCSPDERISGMLLLTLHAPVTATGLYLILSAEQPFREQDRNGIRTISRSICGFQQRLDREKEYPGTAGVREYPFTVTMPPAGITGTTRASGYRREESGERGPGPAGPARWILEGTLDIPPGPGIRGGVRIRVQEKNNPDPILSGMHTADGSAFF